MSNYNELKSDELKEVSGGAGDFQVTMMCTYEDCQKTFDPTTVQTAQNYSQTNDGANLDIMYICPHCNRETKGKVINYSGVVKIVGSL